MPLEVYPTTPVPSFELDYSFEFATEVSDFQGENEQRSLTRRFPTRTFVLLYDPVDSLTEWYLINDFWTSKRGGWAPFWYVFSQIRKWSDIKVGRGDGTTALFDLPSKTTTHDATFKVWVNDVLQVEGVDFDFLSGGGEAGVDRIQFKTGHIPALGALIITTFYGYLRIKAVLGDKISGSWFSPKYDRLEGVVIRKAD